MNALPRTMIAAAVLASTLGCNNAPTPTPIIVGHVADKTRLDKAGERAELGIRLALYELDKNAKLTEALAGRSIRVHHTDARNLDAYETEAVRLASVNRAVALLGGMSLKESTALDQAQVPLLTFHGQRSSSAGKQVFYLGMSPTVQGEVLAKFVAEDPKLTRFVVISDERRGDSVAVSEWLQKTLSEDRQPADAKVLALRFGSEPKWSDLLDRTRSHEPNAIVFAGAAQDFNDWHKAFRREAFLEAPMVIFAGEDGAARSFDLDPQAEVVLATAYLPVAGIERNQSFAKAYRDAYQSDADVHAALAYDGFRMLAEAIKHAQPLLTAERIRDELQKVMKDFDGVTGPLSVSDDRLVQRPLFIARWQNGTLTHLKTHVPAVKKE